MINQIREMLGDREYLETLRKIALPIVIQQFVFASLTMLGVVFVGQKGDVSVAAVGLAGQIAFLVNLVHFGIISGAAMFTAQFWGKQDIQNLRRVLGLCLMFAFSASLVFFVLSQVAPEWILRIYSKDEEVVALGAEYVRALSWTFLFMAVTASYVFVLRSTGNVRLPTVIGVITLLLNTFLSYALIFGLYGFPELGIAGAAYAATISRGLECVALLLIIYKYKYPVAASLRELTDFNAPFIRRVLKPMFPVILNELFWSLGITTYNIIYGRMGTESIAAINIVSPIEQMAFVLFVGLANATSVMVGNRIGEGKEDEAYLYGGRSIWLGIFGGVVMAVFVQLIKAPVIGLFKVSPEVALNAGYIVNIVCLFMWIRVNNMSIVVGILRAGGDTRFSLFLDGFIIWLVGVPLAALGAFYYHLPVYFVYLCVMSEETVKWILGVTRWRSRKWINNLTTIAEG